MPLIAYSPIDQSALARNTAQATIAERIQVSAAQLALAWVLREPGVIAIAKATQEAHLRDNLAAAVIELNADTLNAIDKAFPPPQRQTELAIN